MNILMLTESNYPIDIRVKQEAELLTSHGHSVSVIAIREKDQSYFEKLNGVKIYRVPKIELFTKVDSDSRKNISLKMFRKIISFLKAFTGYSFEYAYFTFVCFLVSCIVIPFDKCNVIHTHNPPDTLFIVAGFFRAFFGIKFVYDHHDLSPDLFMEKYPNRAKFLVRLLLFLEKSSCKIADIIIATNESYKQIEINRCGVKPENIYIVRNGPDLKEMKRTEPLINLRENGKTVLCYIGSINIQDGVQYLIVMLAKMVFRFNFRDVLLLIIGDGDYLAEVKELAKELMVEEYIVFTGMIKSRENVCRYLSSADIFVDAAPHSFLNHSSTFIKHMEYMIFEKPVITFALKESMFSLKDAGVYITPNDTEQMAMSIIDLINDREMQERLGKNAGNRVKEISWEVVSKPLIELYSKLDRT